MVTPIEFAAQTLRRLGVVACGAVLLTVLVMWPRSYFYEDMMSVEVSEGNYASVGFLSVGGVWMYVIPYDAPPWPNNRVPWEDRKLRVQRRSTQDSYGSFLPWWRSFGRGSAGSYVVVPYYITALIAVCAGSLAFLPPLAVLQLCRPIRVSVASLLVAMLVVATLTATSTRLGNGAAIIAFEAFLLLFVSYLAIRKTRRLTVPMPSREVRKE